MILHGGDWFDRPDISPGIAREFAVLIRDFNRPVYSVAGNHDMYGQNPETVRRTMLGVFEAIGLIELLGIDGEIIFEKGGTRLQLTGRPYRYDIDDEDFKRYYLVRKRSDCDYAINMIHGMLVEKPLPQGVAFTLIEEITDTGADITLSGHYHSGFGIKEIGGKYFVNPGSIARLSGTTADIGRMPGVIIIELGETVKIEEIALKSALSGDEVLEKSSPDSIDAENEIRSFFNEVRITLEFGGMNIDGILNKIASDSKIDVKVRNEAIRRISQARERLDAGVDA